MGNEEYITTGERLFGGTAAAVTFLLLPPVDLSRTEAVLTLLCLYGAWMWATVGVNDWTRHMCARYRRAKRRKGTSGR